MGKKDIYIDEFSTFTWRGENSWDKYNVFIINTGEDLKWVSPSFSNEYSQPLYQDRGNGNLMGVTFTAAKYTMKLGIYDVTEKKIREILNWLDPLEIDQLKLNNNPNYYFNVKLNNISDIVKYPMGKENNEEKYYAETTIVWEVQGKNYGYGVENNWVLDIDTGLIIKNYIQKDEENNVEEKIILSENEISEIDNYFKVDFTGIRLEKDANYALLSVIIDKNKNIQYNEDGKTEYLLFNIKPNIEDSTLNFTYDSGNGLLLNKINNEPLSFNTLNENNERIIKEMSVNKYLLPGWFNCRKIYTGNEDKEEPIQYAVALKFCKITKDEKNEIINTELISDIDNNNIIVTEQNLVLTI